MESSKTLQKEIAEFLESLPNIADVKQRRTLILSADLDKQLVNQIDFDLPAKQFITLLIQVSMSYGELANGCLPLERVLNSAESYVGSDKRKICKDLSKRLKDLSKRLIEDGKKTEEGSDIAEAKAAYYQFIQNRYRYLAFKGMGIVDQLPLKISLMEMYIPLKARTQMPEGETWSRGQEPSRHRSEEGNDTLHDARPREPAFVLDLLRKHDGLILLGDPGSGKSTLLKYIALCLATSKNLELNRHLPILLPVSAYVDMGIPFIEFIPRYYELQSLSISLKSLFRQALENGEALLLLDGLDEAKDERMRHKIVNAIESFMAVYKNCKFIMTSRIVGYRNVRPNLGEDVIECTLIDFDENDIEKFVTNWTAAIEQAAQGGDTDIAHVNAQRERTDLLAAIQRDDGLRSLASNPLLLTILAVMKRQGVILPERRAKLYDQYVETLIRHWNLAHGIESSPMKRPANVTSTLRILAPLALWMHETNPTFGLVKRAKLKQQIKQIMVDRHQVDSEEAAEHFLAELREDTGLLVERGYRTYGFIHLSFQEYLAAVGLAQKIGRDTHTIVEQLTKHIEDNAWREVFLLTIGHIGTVMRLEDVTSNLLLDLMNQTPGRSGIAIIRAGEAVADVGKEGISPDCYEKVIEALQQMMRDDTKIPAQRRAAAGCLLAQLGDPRPEVLDVAGMELCYVPPGDFLHIGYNNDEKNKQSQRWHEIPYGYWLGRYPVTNAQYELFIAAGGYANEAYWEEAKKVKVWQEGNIRGGEEDELRCRPAQYGHPFHLSNHPVIGLTWYEALAFTRWLTEKAQIWLPDGWQIRLPSEAEWEKAKWGGRQIPTPKMIRPLNKLTLTPESIKMNNFDSQVPCLWGKIIDPNQANYGKSGIGATNAVGCFPGNASPYGVEEMAGNMFEWLLSEYELGESFGHNRVTASHHERVVKSFAFYTENESQLRGVRRDGRNPSNVYRCDGFRICVANQIVTI